MPEAHLSPSIWLRVGRILPRRVRERVFEPVFYDLMAEALDPSSGGARFPGASSHFGLRMAWATVECFGIGLTGAIVRRGRPTLTAWILVGVAAISTLLVLMRTSYESPGS